MKEKYSNINYKINLGYRNIYVPKLILYPKTFLSLLIQLRNDKNKIYELMHSGNDKKSGVCVLVQLYDNFNCEKFVNCNQCIFKPYNIRELGMGNFFKFLSLSRHCDFFEGCHYKMK